MKRICLFLAVVACMSLVAAPASAGLMAPGLTFDSILDVWQDNSVAMAFDLDGDFTVSAGDQLLGIVRMKTNTTDAIDLSPTLGELDIVFAFQVLTATPRPGGAVPDVAYTLGVAPGVLSATLPSFGGAIGAGDAIAILSDPKPVPAVGFDATQLSAAGPAWARLNDGSFQLDATGALVASTDFIEATLIDALGVGGIPIGTPGYVPDGLITLPGHLLGYEYATWAVTTKTGDEAGGLTFTSTPGVGGGIIWLPVPETHLTGAPFPSGTTTFHDISFDSTLRVPDATQIGNGWIFSDDSRVKMNPTPEPASVLVWGALALMGLGFGYWRRRRRAA